MYAEEKRQLLVELCNLASQEKVHDRSCHPSTAIHLLFPAWVMVLQPPLGQQQEVVSSLDTKLSDIRWWHGQQQQPRTMSSAARRRGEAEETPVEMPWGEPLIASPPPPP
ncbi:hypothetical protein E2562_036580 [Oryza meyeriana var. granulata]|uniref:Uncharacterized protein n=1 Tax=Oryza meyeriana var. granulata TaxID=110450 RepID=A0A6G1EBH6_9ORYZ|nr:hypothetical protein E2562_036580 [Oryza meyeriana var. granulata]